MAVTARLIAVALAGFLAGSSALAQSAVGTAAAWGLLGTWKIDCSAPPSREDPDLKFVVRSGKLFHERDWGDDSDSNPVLSVAATSGGGLQVTVKFGALSQTRQWAYIMRADGRIRAVSNRNVGTGEYSIRDGRLTSSGDLTQWQTHCRGPRNSSMSRARES